MIWQQFPSSNVWSSDIGDIVIATDDHTLHVVVSVKDIGTVYDETLAAAGDRSVRLMDMAGLIEPWAKQLGCAYVTVTASERYGEQDQSRSFSAWYSAASIDGASFREWTDAHFLTLHEGPRRTAPGRLEYLHAAVYDGDDGAANEVTVEAHYTKRITSLLITAAGTYPAKKKFTVSPVSQSPVTIASWDVSPDRFIREDEKDPHSSAILPSVAHFELLYYDVTYNSECTENLRKTMRFIVGEQEDCAPVLLFENSFGCEELLYCRGRHKVSPTYTRSQAYMGRVMKTYRTEELRKFSADTGPLTVPEQNWADDLLRSPKIRLVNFYQGQAAPGREIVITDSKSEVTNDWDAMPAFTFDYRYATHRQNIIQARRAGRIFDNTFDNTFN